MEERVPAKGLVTSTNKISCVFLNFMPCFRIAIFLPNIFHCNWFLIVSSTFYKIENSSPSQTIIFSATKKVKFSISMDHWFHRLKFILKHSFSPHPSILKFFTFHQLIFRTTHYHRYFVLLKRERKETGQTRSQNVVERKTFVVISLVSFICI